MVIRINDDDGNALEEYRFDPRKFITAEAILAEKVTGMFWAHLMVAMQNGSVTAIAAALWLLKRREDPKIKYVDVVFNAGMTEVIDPDDDPRYAEPEPDLGPEDDEAETPPGGAGRRTRSPKSWGWGEHQHPGLSRAHLRSMYWPVMAEILHLKPAQLDQLTMEDFDRGAEYAKARTSGG